MYKRQEQRQRYITTPEGKTIVKTRYYVPPEETLRKEAKKHPPIHRAILELEAKKQEYRYKYSPEAAAVGFGTGFAQTLLSPFVIGETAIKKGPREAGKELVTGTVEWVKSVPKKIKGAPTEAFSLGGELAGMWVMGKGTAKITPPATRFVVRKGKGEIPHIKTFLKSEEATVGIRRKGIEQYTPKPKLQPAKVQARFKPRPVMERPTYTQLQYLLETRPATSFKLPRTAPEVIPRELSLAKPTTFWEIKPKIKPKTRAFPQRWLLGVGEKVGEKPITAASIGVAAVKPIIKTKFKPKFQPETRFKTQSLTETLLGTKTLTKPKAKVKTRPKLQIKTKTQPETLPITKTATKVKVMTEVKPLTKLIMPPLIPKASTKVLRRKERKKLQKEK